MVAAVAVKAASVYVPVKLFDKFKLGAAWLIVNVVLAVPLV